NLLALLISYSPFAPFLFKTLSLSLLLLAPFHFYPLSLPLPLIQLMLKIGVFGVGHLGKFHLNNWKTIPGITLVGFYDPSDTIAKEVIDKYQLTRFSDADALMDS